MLASEVKPMRASGEGDLIACVVSVSVTCRLGTAGPSRVSLVALLEWVPHSGCRGAPSSAAGGVAAAGWVEFPSGRGWMGGWTDGRIDVGAQQQETKTGLAIAEKRARRRAQLQKKKANKIDGKRPLE